MARRRYLSTEISVDARVNRLAELHGDFAALLYTWLIPHADDAGELTADPEQLLYMVVPGRRSKSVADISAAVTAILELELMSIDDARGVLRFPASFWKHQSYITKTRRASAQSAADQRRSAQCTEDQRKPAQNTTSFSFPVSFPVSSSGSDSEKPDSGGGAYRARAHEDDDPPPPLERQARYFSREELDKLAAFDDGLFAAGAEYKRTTADNDAILASPETPELLAEAVAAVYHGTWGDDFIREHLNVGTVAKQVNGYKAVTRGGRRNHDPKTGRFSKSGTEPTVSDEAREYFREFGDRSRNGSTS